MKRKKPDWETIFKTALVFAIIIGSIYFLDLAPGFLHLAPENKTDKQIKAQVIQLNKISGKSQEITNRINAIFIQYRYLVGDSAYFGNATIPYVGDRNKIWIDSLLHTPADSVWIRYKEGEPGKSLIRIH